MGLINKLRKQLIEVQSRIKAAENFPDLEEVVDRWGIAHLVTDQVNSCAIDFEVRPECECCDGVKVYALPYIEYEGIRLYSKTPAISFAKRYKTKNGYTYDDSFSLEFEEFDPELQTRIMDWIDSQEMNN